MNVFRRRFLQSITAASAGSLTLATATQRKSVIYQVKGFTCITCAVGLEVMLSRQKGVLKAKASYPQASVEIDFDSSVVPEGALHDYIAEMGFSVAP